MYEVTWKEETFVCDLMAECLEVCSQWKAEIQAYGLFLAQSLCKSMEKRRRDTKVTMPKATEVHLCYSSDYRELTLSSAIYICKRSPTPVQKLCSETFLAQSLSNATASVLFITVVRSLLFLDRKWEIFWLCRVLQSPHRDTECPFQELYNPQWKQDQWQSKQGLPRYFKSEKQTG